jgi:predicted PurR-regulated permease PerM
MATRPRASSANTVALWVLAVIATLFFLRFAKTLLIPIALAVLVSYALEPVVGWLERHRVGRTAAAALVMIAILGAAAFGAYTLKDDAVQMVKSLPKAAERAREMVATQLGTTELLDQTQATGTSGRSQSSGGGNAGAAEGSGARAPGSLLQRAAGAVFEFAGHLVVIFFLVFFLLLSGSSRRAATNRSAAGWR